MYKEEKIGKRILPRLLDPRYRRFYWRTVGKKFGRRVNLDLLQLDEYIVQLRRDIARFESKLKIEA